MPESLGCWFALYALRLRVPTTAVCSVDALRKKRTDLRKCGEMCVTRVLSPPVHAVATADAAVVQASKQHRVELSIPRDFGVEIGFRAAAHVSENRSASTFAPTLVIFWCGLPSVVSFEQEKELAIISV